MPSKPLEPGDPVRLGRFELLGRLGEGGQGVVYLGRGTNPGEDRVAVKVLRSTVDANVLERLARELDAIHQVQPFVTAGVIEASAEGDRRYVVSEFIDGPSLQERVDDRGPLPEGDLQRLAVGTATALTAIHGAGVVHRDFKPANVLLGPDGPRVVLAVVLLTRGSPPASPAGPGGNALAGTASSPAATVPQTTSPPPATTGATIPAAFAGTWKGKATMAAVGDTSLGLTNNITFTFAAGARTIHETDKDSYGGSCVNTLTLRAATATVLTFDEPQTAGCVAGTVTFTRQGATLAYRWTDNIEQNTATLRRS
jgi:serine/threonine protein kinase